MIGAPSKLMFIRKTTTLPRTRSGSDFDLVVYYRGDLGLYKKGVSDSAGYSP